MGMAIHVVINTITINHHHHQALLLVVILLRILLSFHTSFPFLSFPFLSFLHALSLSLALALVHAHHIIILNQ